MAAGVACGARHPDSLPGHERPPLKVTSDLDVARLLNGSAVQLDVNCNQRVLADPGKKRGDDDAKVEAGDRTDA